MFSRCKQFVRDSRIQQKITMGYSLVTLLLALSLGIFSTYFISQHVVGKIIDQSLETVRLLSMNIDYNIQLINDKLSYLSYNPQIQQQLQTDMSGANIIAQDEARRTMSKFMIQVYTSVTMEDLEIYGHDGQNYYITMHTRKRPFAREEEFLDTAWASLGKNIVINDTHGSGNIQIVKRINDLVSMRPIGVLRASLKRSTIQKFVNEIDFASGGSIILLDREGKTVLGDEAFFPPDVYGLFPDWEGSFAYRSGATEYMVMYRRSDYTGWTTVGVIPRSVLSGSVRPLQTTLLAVTLLALVFCMLISRGISRVIVTPLTAVVGAFERFAEGDFSVRLAIDRGDETGWLSGGFNNMIERIGILVDEIYKGESAKRELEFKALQAQINPHFLYNTLDTINWMARKEDMGEICDMVTAVSNLMRISISNKRSFITVEDELRYVSDYLYIQKVRYRERLQFRLDVAPALLPLVIPKLILQPVVENAVVHGLEASKKPLAILLTGKRLDNDTVAFVVEDNGVGIPADRLESILQAEPAEEAAGHTSLGLHAVHRRIQHVYGAHYGVHIASREGRWTRVTIHIPHRSAESAIPLPTPGSRSTPHPNPEEDLP